MNSIHKGTFLRWLFLKEFFEAAFLHLQQKRLKLKAQHRNLQHALPHSRGTHINDTLLRAKCWWIYGECIAPPLTFGSTTSLVGEVVSARIWNKPKTAADYSWSWINPHQKFWLAKHIQSRVQLMRDCCCSHNMEIISNYWIILNTLSWGWTFQPK